MKKMFLSFFCFMTLLFSVGCSCEPKVAITTEQFVAICEENNYETIDVSEQYSQFTQIQDATVARSGSDWQIEFYVLDTDVNAIAMFATNQSLFESYDTGSSTQSSVTMQNYSTFMLKTGGYYMYLCQVDNTLLYVRVASQFENSVTALIDALGY